VIWLVTESGGSGSKSASNTTGPVVLSQSGLNTLATQFGQPLYWVGAKKGTMYELTQSPNTFLLCYLPKGVKAGSSNAYLSIGTYAMTDAYNRMKGLAGKPGTTAFDVPGGGIGLVNKSRPTSVYVGFPGSNFQIEVYDPKAAVARRLTESG